MEKWSINELLLWDTVIFNQSYKIWGMKVWGTHEIDQSQWENDHEPMYLLSHMLHVWNIYLHDWAILGVNVSKYSIHRASGFFLWPIFSQARICLGNRSLRCSHTLVLHSPKHIDKTNLAWMCVPWDSSTPYPLVN
jgi:hypothetical protein